MRMDHESSLTPRWIVFGTALVYFALGSVLTAHFMHLKEVWADSHRVFQLEIHHAVPALAERFRSASKLQVRHGLEVVGYWVPDDATFTPTNPAFADTLVYLVAHGSQEAAKIRGDAFHADPAFQEYLQPEKAEQLIQGVDSTFMQPTDSSATK